MTRDVEPVVPPEATFLMVDKGRRHESSAGRRSIPFPERDGEWAGYPAGDAEAIAELRRQQANGARFIVFPRPMFYWLEAYPGLKKVLQVQGRCIADNDQVLIFEL